VAFVVHEHVGRLEIAVDDAAAMGVVQGAGNLPGDVEGGLGGQRFLRANAPGEAAALDVLRTSLFS